MQQLKGRLRRTVLFRTRRRDRGPIAPMDGGRAGGRDPFRGRGALPSEGSTPLVLHPAAREGDVGVNVVCLFC